MNSSSPGPESRTSSSWMSTYGWDTASLRRVRKTWTSLQIVVKNDGCADRAISSETSEASVFMRSRKRRSSAFSRLIFISTNLRVQRCPNSILIRTSLGMKLLTSEILRTSSLVRGSQAPLILLHWKRCIMILSNGHYLVDSETTSTA